MSFSQLGGRNLRQEKEVAKQAGSTQKKTTQKRTSQKKEIPKNSGASKKSKDL
jgi:hypothetical protein